VLASIKSKEHLFHALDKARLLQCHKCINWCANMVNEGLLITFQVSQHSPITYLQKFASQPMPQLPTPQAVQQQFLPSRAPQANPPGHSQQHGSKGNVETASGAGLQKALQLPLLRPAPPVLRPFAGMVT